MTADRRFRHRTRAVRRAHEQAMAPAAPIPEDDARAITLRLSTRVPALGTWGMGFADARLIVSAIRGGWVTDDMGEALAAAMTRLVKSADPRAQIAAGRVLTALASVDVSRERNDTTERGQDMAAMTSTLQALARDHPELYGQLCRALAEQQRKQVTDVHPRADGTPGE